MRHADMCESMELVYDVFVNTTEHISITLKYLRYSDSPIGNISSHPEM